MMEQMSEGLLLWRNMLLRHDCTMIIWEMKNEEGDSRLECISANVQKYGYSSDEFLDGSVAWLDLILEEDRARVNQEGCQFLLRAEGNLVQEYRIVTKEGKIIWVEADSCYIVDNNGESAHVETLVRNIHKNKERERILLNNQEAIQKELIAYMETSSQKGFKENLIDFIKEQRLETLQAAFSEIYGIHVALIGRDYYFYTHMTGPKEEEGIFYDLAELQSFRKKIDRLESILDTGQRNVILSMQSPGIRISGVPVFYKEEYVATWIVCCLSGKSTEDILRILEFMRIMSETISEHYSHHIGQLSAKGYAFERYRLQKRVLMQEKLLELYDEMEDMAKKEKLSLILKKAGETSNSGRCTLYEAVPNSIYARCVVSWITQEAPWNQMEREMYSVQALPNPEALLKGQEIIVLNSIHVPKEWLDTMSDLYASAAVIMPIEWEGKQGFLCFQEIGEERVWEEEFLWFFRVIKKIIEKVLLKSE